MFGLLTLTSIGGASASGANFSATGVPGDTFTLRLFDGWPDRASRRWRGKVR